MIKDERLKELIDETRVVDTAYEYDPYIQDIADSLTELQTSRQTIKRLVEDGERMVSKYKMLRNNCPDMLVEEARECISNTNAAILIQCLADMDDVIDQHIALLKELEEKK